MSESKRELIMNAALALFVERGFDGTTVPMISEKAGVGAGTIYRYFENKEALVNSLYQKYVGSFLRDSKMAILVQVTTYVSNFGILRSRRFATPKAI